MERKEAERHIRNCQKIGVKAREATIFVEHLLTSPYPLLDKLKYLTTSVLARFLEYPVGKRLRGPGQMEPAAIESIFYGFLSWNPGASRGREREGTTASIQKEQKLSKKKRVRRNDRP